MNSDYKLAHLTFKHQIVYDLNTRKERYLNDPTAAGDLSFLGKISPPDTAFQKAIGIVNPMTLKKYEYHLNRFHFNSDQKRISNIANSLNGFHPPVTNEDHQKMQDTYMAENANNGDFAIPR